MWSAGLLLVVFFHFSSGNQDLRGGQLVTGQSRILNRKPLKVDDTRLNAAKTNTPTPSCSTDEISAFACLIDSNYPTDLVNSVIQQHSDLMEQLHSQLYRHNIEDLILMDNLTHTYRFKGNFACESDVAWVKLGWARDISGRFLLVVNSARYPQIIRLESCKYPDKRCEYLPPCYRSVCRQRYTHSHVIVIDPMRPSAGPFVQLVPTPTACACFVENFTYF